MHSLALRLEMLALVHGQAASTAAEAVALRTELTAVADFAVQLALVLGAVCRVEQFAAKTCNTRFVARSLEITALLSAAAVDSRAVRFADANWHRGVPYILLRSVSTCYTRRRRVIFVSGIEGRLRRSGVSAQSNSGLFRTHSSGEPMQAL